jgi:hypothetical protein
MNNFSWELFAHFSDRKTDECIAKIVLNSSGDILFICSNNKEKLRILPMAKMIIDNFKHYLYLSLLKVLSSL